MFGSVNDTIWIKESRKNGHGGLTQVSFPIRFDVGREIESVKKGHEMMNEMFADIPNHETVSLCTRVKRWLKGG